VLVCVCVHMCTRSIANDTSENKGHSGSEKEGKGHNHFCMASGI
jgi:hypothetical protein